MGQEKCQHSKVWTPKQKKEEFHLLMRASLGPQENLPRTQTGGQSGAFVEAAAVLEAENQASQHKFVQSTASSHQGQPRKIMQKNALSRPRYNQVSHETVAMSSAQCKMLEK